jgi:hypothetical protein
MKKFLLCALCATLLLTCVACGEKPCETHTDTDWNYVCDVCQTEIPLVNVDYTFTFLDQDGLPVSGVSFTLSQGSTTVATLTANENGVATGNIVAGPYTLTLTQYPIGYFPDAGFQEILITADAASQTILFENTIPNGSITRPFHIIEDETPVTLEANQTLYYHSFGEERILRIESTLVAVQVGEDTYLADENGVIEVLLTAENAREGFSFSITNLDVENPVEITFTMYSPPGSRENPLEATLDTSCVASVKKGSAIYYIITAEADGILTFTTTSTFNNTMLYNLTSYQVTEYSNGALTLSVNVSVGDEVRVEVSTIANEETAIDFTLTLTPVVEE